MSDRKLYQICTAIAMGGFLFGYDWVVIGGAKPFYEPYFSMTDSPWIQGWTMSSALVGCLIGAVLVGMLSDWFGRKKLLMVAAILFLISALGDAMSASLFDFNFYRILGGIGIGLVSSLSPVLIAELAPASSRGKLVSINQLMIVIGILAAQLVNWAIASFDKEAMKDAALISASWSGQMGWRLMLGAEVIPAIVFLILLAKVPESPRWLMSKHHREQAHRVLSKIRSAEQASAELDAISSSLEDRPSRTRVGLRVLWLGVFLAVFQQWCGINVIFNYAQEIFASAGYGISATMFNIVITGVVNLLATVVSMVTVDRWGRRTLMLIGSFGLTVLYGVLGFCYWRNLPGPHLVAILLMAIACYALSLAPVVWVVISELFANGRRGLDTSICVASLWIACGVLTISFPTLNRYFEAHGAFWAYGLVCLVGGTVVYCFLPETKGTSLDCQ
jgi:sugar porter (SP) family MFS transporter